MSRSHAISRDLTRSHSGSGRCVAPHRTLGSTVVEGESAANRPPRVGVATISFSVSIRPRYRARLQSPISSDITNRWEHTASAGSALSRYCGHFPPARTMDGANVCVHIPTRIRRVSADPSVYRHGDSTGAAVYQESSIRVGLAPNARVREPVPVHVSDTELRAISAAAAVVVALDSCLCERASENSSFLYQDAGLALLCSVGRVMFCVVFLSFHFSSPCISQRIPSHENKKLSMYVGLAICARFIRKNYSGEFTECEFYEW